MVRQNNPQIQVDASSIQKQDAQVASAKREGKPDFEVGYMYENTDRKYRDYYMFTFDVRFPRKKRVNAEIAEATENTPNRNRHSMLICSSNSRRCRRGMSKRRATKSY